MKTDKPSNDVKIAVLENTTSHIEETLNRIDRRLDKLEQKMDDGFKSVNNRMWFIYANMVAGFASILYVIAKGFHWLQ